MDSSIGLSLLLSQIAPPPFNSTFLTFSSEPQLVELDSADGFVANVRKMGRADWGQSTNILATFRLILQRSVEAKLEPSLMIKRLFIFSDMQFDVRFLLFAVWERISGTNSFSGPLLARWPTTRTSRLLRLTWRIRPHLRLPSESLRSKATSSPSWSVHSSSILVL